jgi:hypothetical protein
METRTILAGHDRSSLHLNAKRLSQVQMLHGDFAFGLPLNLLCVAFIYLPLKTQKTSLTLRATALKAALESFTMHTHSHRGKSGVVIERRANNIFKLL